MTAPALARFGAMLEAAPGDARGDTEDDDSP
jgi:hypothetical protein